MRVQPCRHPWIGLRMAVTIACLVAMLTLSGCGRISGTYADDEGNSIEFAGEHAYVTFYPAPTMEARYEITDDKVIIRASGDAMVLTRRGDALEGGPFGMIFTLSHVN